jgi:Holliday junction DNA helicase RuvB
MICWSRSDREPKVFVEAANQRNGFRSHPFHGPPGLGKTTLANILAELQVGIKITSGPV